MKIDIDFPHRLMRWWPSQLARLRTHGRRLSLWTALLLLVLALLATTWLTS